MTGRAALHTKTAPISTTPEASRPTERRSIPDTTLNVYPLALGGSVFGWTADGDTSMQILDRHAGLGGNMIDTADSYAGGRSEVLIGNWLRTRRRGRTPSSPPRPDATSTTRA
jgi:diketogulonate reductase-like aldo/keto reductase